VSFYAKPIRQRLGVWTALSPGAEYADCDGAAHVHFTNVHHRQIAAIESRRADVGLVWRTETLAVIADGAPVHGLSLPPGQNAVDQVGYVAGAFGDSPHAAAAAAFIGFLGSQPGQDPNAAYGFVPATKGERTPRLLPAN